MGRLWKLTNSFVMTFFLCVWLIWLNIVNILCNLAILGPDGQELISTFQSRSNTNYLKSIGQSLVEIAKVVPDGLLIFFPSYAWMDTYLTNWKQMGIWDRLNQWKQCFVEPKDRNALTRMVHEFRAKVRHPSRVGATFMAVCRGKVSGM